MLCVSRYAGNRCVCGDDLQAGDAKHCVSTTNTPTQITV